MNFPEIKVYLLAKSVPDRGAIESWVNDMMPDDQTHFVPLEDESTAAETLIAYAAKRCYKSFEPGLNPNVTKVRKDLTAFFDNILKSGHGSVLEHASWTFAFENVTRVFTGEMNRHRAGVAISEGSMRYIRFDDIPFWMPLSLRGEDKEASEELCKYIGSTHVLSDAAIEEERRRDTVMFIGKILKDIESTYTKLCEIWDIDNQPFDKKKKLTSMFRRIIPMGVCTGGVWTMNCRAMRHIIEMRTSPAAEEEIVQVFSGIAQIMVEQEPRLFGDFTGEDGCWTPKYHKV